MPSLRVFLAPVAVAVAALAALAPPRPASAQPTLETYVLSGQMTPDGNGQFLTAEGPVLNDFGSLSFVAQATGTAGGETSPDRFGVFQLDEGEVSQVARGLGMAPGGAEQFGGDFLSPPPANSDSILAFSTSLHGGEGQAGIYISSPTLLGVIADRSSSPLDGNGTFVSFEFPAINDLDLVAFRGGLTGATPEDVDSGIFRGSGGALTTIARRQDAAPDGDGAFDAFGAPAINELGRVGFSAELNATGAAGGVFRGDGGAVAQVARAGQPAPGAGGGDDGEFASFATDVAINDQDELAFVAQLTGTSGGADDDLAVFRGGDAASTVRIATKGQPTPEGGGEFLAFGAPVVNNSGMVAVRAEISSGAADDDGVYIGDGASLATVARDGAAAPDGNGVFDLLESPTLNEAGQLVFSAEFRDATPGAEGGVLFWDPAHGLSQVARTGDELLGSTISELNLASRGGANAVEHSGLNNSGEVAFSFLLANGDAGVAVWSFAPTPVLQGDFNGDGVVDAADFTRWRDNLGAPDESALGDAGDGAGGVDAGDYALWRENYGATLEGPSPAAPVPAPGGASTLLGAALLGAVRRWRQWGKGRN